MLRKIKNKPMWYRFWFLSVVVAAIYALVKMVFLEPTALDHFIQAYALLSIVLDMVLFPENQENKEDN